MYTPHTLAEERRQYALEQAIRMVTAHGGYTVPEDATMSAANTFEAYLKGDDA